jgi:hypothetical protein
MDELAPADLMSDASDQIHARKVVKKAVEDIPIADVMAITPEEKQALRAAIEAAFAAEVEDAPAIHQFEDAVKRELHELTLRFNSPEPAFAFIQDEDWRWILPLSDPPPPLHVVRHENVGRRYVLLLANKAAMDLLYAHP